MNFVLSFMCGDVFMLFPSMNFVLPIMCGDAFRVNLNMMLQIAAMCRRRFFEQIPIIKFSADIHTRGTFFCPNI